MAGFKIIAAALGIHHLEKAKAPTLYPLANELTLLMCNPPTFRERLDSIFTADGDGPKNFHTDSVITTYVKQSAAAALLRDTDFATMDELSKHVLGGGHAEKVRELKKLMRLMLALHNPDVSHYSLSDYRPLIHKLFMSGSLRPDVTIISYNYDAYLEYRLRRVFQARQEPTGAPPKKNTLQAICSGFLDPHDLNWLQEDGFCHLKLHGTCAFPAGRRVGNVRLPLPPDSAEEFQSQYLFENFKAILRLAQLVQPPFSMQDPPAVLPWEIIHDKAARLLSVDEFASGVGKDWQHVTLHPLFRGIWEQARKKVQYADKISIVGLSLGDYLRPGLRYLFAGQDRPVQFVVANPDNQKFPNSEGRLHPNSPAGLAVEILKWCGMNGQIQASFSEHAGFDPGDFDARKAGDMEPSVTCHNSFREFIDAEL